jgi:DNA-binding transcriptional ArsR family regulator
VSDRDREAVRILRAMAHPARLRLLNALRDGEECVCHLTALLNQRQAYVSQQLASLRAAGLISERKEGLRVYYRIRDPRTHSILRSISAAPRAQGQTILRDWHCPTCEGKKVGA